MCHNLKYNIRKKLFEMEGSYRTNLYRLCIEMNCTTTTAERWVKLETTDKRSLTVDALYGLAKFFNCNPTDLVNGEAQKQ